MNQTFPSGPEAIPKRIVWGGSEKSWTAPAVVMRPILPVLVENQRFRSGPVVMSPSPAPLAPGTGYSWINGAGVGGTGIVVRTTRFGSAFGDGAPEQPEIASKATPNATSVKPATRAFTG